MIKLAVLALLGVLGLGSSATHAQVTFDLTTVGNINNPDDSTGYGSVSYTYNIATKEVNLFQYAAFLNAVAATDTYGLYDTNMATNANVAGITRSGTSGSYTYAVSGSGDRPVTYVNWFDAARFANWVANGQPTGGQTGATTENGAYTLNGATSGVSFTKNGINPNTLEATTYWIPSNDEWYKAAYYDPTKGGSNYWMYPTQSDIAPGNTVGSGTNQANYYVGVYSVTQNANYESGQNYLAAGGAYSNSASYYGTYDQAGSVWEWNDDVVGSNRVIRGGSWNSNTYLQSSSSLTIDPSYADSLLGFRLASVPEPAISTLIFLGTVCFLANRRKG